MKTKYAEVLLPPGVFVILMCLFHGVVKNTLDYDFPKEKEMNNKLTAAIYYLIVKNAGVNASEVQKIMAFFDIDFGEGEKMMDNGKNEERLKVLFKALNSNAAIPVRNGAAYDLFIPEDVKIEAGETVKIRLGFACKLPDGYHALINMRSSTWGKWGLCLSNQTGIIDNGYCGESDEWILSVYRPNSFKEFPTLIPAGTRIAQFRLERDCPELEFEKVDHLTSLSRGGFGSTGD